MTAEEKTVSGKADVDREGPDDHYVKAASGGNREAFDELVSRHQQSVINAAAYYLGNYEDALEVAQETFLKAWKAVSGFEGKASFRTWLLRITLNTARSFHSRRTALKRSGSTATISMRTSSGAEDEGDREIADSSEEPHQLVEKKELGEVIEKAIGSLQEDARRIIILRDILGESYQAIAGEEGLTLGTVKTRVHRARLELRVILADFL